MERCHFSALCLSCHRMPRGTVGRGHGLFAEQVVSSRLGACVPYGPRALTKVNVVGPRERDPLESTAGQGGVSLRSTTSGVDRPRASPRLTIIKALRKFGRLGRCPLLIPTGRDNRGGGDTIGGGTIGAWRPRASVPRTVIIVEERWLSSHTPQLSVGRNPTHEGSVHEV